MKTLNPVEDLITKTAKLYFELCQVAEAQYQMGPHSGAKRTILLYLNQRGSSLADELWDQFPDPSLRDLGPKIILEMVESRWISTERQRGRVVLLLTELGRAKVEQIIKREAMLASELPPELNIGELRRAIKTIETFQEAIHEIRDVRPHISEEAS
jgi:hypothetical protein